MARLGGPAALTSFVGRSTELAELRRLLGGARLVTLIGPGGVGKTRLAKRLAEEVARAFPDGTHVVELAQVEDPATVATAVAISLGLEDFGQSPEAALAAYVRQRRLLLVLDNCEHLVDACARVAGDLLQSAPQLRVLATSRQVLGLRGEQLMPVGPLSLPPEGASTTPELAESEAVALFVERARLVDRAFRPDGENASAVARLCNLLDGIPLAIELAAARLRLLTPVQLADRIGDRVEDRFGLLSALATAGTTPRHATLRESVEWSYDLCSEHEQAIWARLSLFEGGVDLEAAEAVCSGSEIPVFDAVAGLVDKSVLAPHEDAGRVRYRMLETIRDYGLERLAERGETDEVRARHCDYFVALAKSVAGDWFGPDQHDLLARLVAEQGNLRVALATATADPQLLGQARELTTAIWHAWPAVGALEEGNRWFERALSGPLPSTPLALRALRRGAYLAAMANVGERVKQYAARGLDLTVEDSDGVRLDRAWLLALTHQDTLDTAVEGGPESLTTGAAEARIGPQDTVELLEAHAVLQSLTGHPHEALKTIHAGIRVCDRFGETWHRSFLMCLEGARLADLEQWGQALDVLRAALRMARGFNVYSVINAVEFAARIYASIGQGEEAAVLQGALSAFWPDVGGSLIPGERDRHLSAVGQARELIGEAGFESAYGRGRAMTLDEVIELVLGEPLERRRKKQSGSHLAGTALTEREAEVAELVARGLSNKQIAHALVISSRTAEGHVTRVLGKLGFTSRARVAAWVAEQRSRVDSPTFEEHPPS